MSNPRFWLVEMINDVDAADNEVWKIRAVSRSAARIIAQSSDEGRFIVGTIVRARGGTKADRELAADFRTYVTRTFK